MQESQQSIIDFKRYVAIGDSITAGYMDGALCYYGQMHSYSYFLSQQFKLVGGGNFNQCLVPPTSIGLGFWGNSCLEKKSTTLSPEHQSIDIGYIAPHGDFSIVSTNHFQVEQPFQNLGIPATKLTTLLYPSYGNPQHGAGNFNPFFTRVASNPLTASVLGDALMQVPTFFTLFAGNNDALKYALAGCTDDGLTPLEGEVGFGFEASAKAILQALTTNGAKGVVANLPSLDVTSYFRTIPFDGLLLNDTEAVALQQQYATHHLAFTSGKNAFVVNDSVNNQESIRQMKKEEYILLDVLLDPEKDLFLMGIKPIPKKYFLTEAEIQHIQNRLDDYNTCLEKLAHEFQLAFVDTDKLLRVRSVDRVYHPSDKNFYYKQGGVFSLDGLHPNVYGQALLANEFIHQINATYKTQVPIIDADLYKHFEPPVLKAP